MAGGVTITGDASAAILARLAAGVHRATEEEIEEAAANLKATAPVLTGRHRAGIEGRMTSSAEGEITSDEGIEYPIHLEFGTSRMPARPRFTEEAERMKVRYPDRLAKAVKDAADG